MVTKVKKSVKKARRVFLLERADKQLLASHLVNESTSFTSGTMDVEELWANFEHIINHALEKYVPKRGLRTEKTHRGLTAQFGECSGSKNSCTHGTRKIGRMRTGKS